MDTDDPAMDDAPTLPRSMAWAIVCDAVVPGLGHWYLGSLRQAVVIAGLFVVIVPALVVAVVAFDLGLALALWLLLGGAWLLRLIAAMHAGVLAKRGVHVPPSRAQSLGVYLAFAALVLGLGYATTTQLRGRVLEALVVPASSGRPNIDAGDRVLVTKLRARDRAAQRGDLITFFVPGDRAVFVKRVVAVEGESVSITAGQVSIDGVALASSPCEDSSGLALSPGAICLRERTPEGASYRVQLLESGAQDFAPTPIPAGHVFVLGDNRFESHDSRAFGPVPLSSVTGRARRIYAPLDRAGSLDPQ